MIIKNNQSLSNILSYNLKQNNYYITVTHNNQNNLNRTQHQTPNIIILNLILPIINNLKIYQQIQTNPTLNNILIMILTTKTKKNNHIINLTISTNNYITKPFNIQILLKQIKALLRHQKKNKNDHHIITNQNIILDKQQYRITINNKSLNLTQNKFTLLEILIQQPDHTFTQQ